MNCGALCVQFIHQSHGHKISLHKARKICQTNRNGTHILNMVKALEQLGYSNVRIKQNLKWSELKRLSDTGNDLIVDWYSDLYPYNTPVPPDGHYCVVKKVTKDAITLFDVDPMEEVTLPRKYFESRWYDWERDKAGKRTDYSQPAIIARYPRKSPPPKKIISPK